MDPNIVSKLTKRYLALLKLGWSAIKESKLGIVGICIILAFSVMAVLAPVISPYKPSYRAPEIDLFEFRNYNKSYPAGSYLEPVVGPTTPTFSTIDGGQWIIVPTPDGIIYMDFAKSVLVNQSTPFEKGGISIAIDLQQIQLSPPLVKVIYMVPGGDYMSRFGERTRTGLIVIVADTTLAIVDPFQYPNPSCVLFREDLQFTPKWLVEDTASSGDMYSIPLESSRVDMIWGEMREGPYRYIVVASETRLVAYKVEYLQNVYGLAGSDGVPYSPMRICDLTMNVSAEPLTYVNQDSPDTSSIIVPSNNQIYVYDLDGGLKTTFDLNISGAPATVTNPMTFSRTPFPQYVFVPLRGTTRDSLITISLSDNRILNPFTPIYDGHISGRPSPSKEQYLYILYDFDAPVEGIVSRVYRMNYNGTVDEGFQGNLTVAGKEMYYVSEASRLFVVTDNGEIWYAVSAIGGSITAGFHKKINLESGTDYLVNVGALSGTKYGQLSNNEGYGLQFIGAEGKLTLFQYVGSSRAPLPPGKYASGNTYYLGTDNVGHDILTHLIYGTQVAFLVGVLSALFTVVLGTLIGLISGYYGGFMETILMRFTDIILVLPTLPIILIWSAIWGANIWMIIVILASLGWPGIARVIRAETLSLKQRPFIDAARIGGSSDMRIILKHLAPNVIPYSFLFMTLSVAGAIITEAALSFLGMGDPKAITWGIMLSTIQSSGNTLHAWWWLMPPGVAITVLSLGFYLVGRAVDEIVNPRLRKR
jgi:peptide/nickel transport system permease protein